MECYAENAQARSQAVTCRGFVVGEMALRQVFLQIARFPLLISLYQVSVLIVYSSTTYAT